MEKYEAQLSFQLSREIAQLMKIIRLKENRSFETGTLPSHHILDVKRNGCHEPSTSMLLDRRSTVRRDVL